MNRTGHRALGRRGVTLEGAMMAVIIFGVVMIILILIYQLVFSLAKEQFTKEECRASLLLTRKADVRGNLACIATVDNPIPLKCSRRFVTVGKGGVAESVKLLEYDGRCPAGMGGDCTAENVIAQEMASCYTTFFEGEQLVFQQAERNSMRFWDPQGDNTACFVCAEVSLLPGEDVTQFREYVKRAKYSKNQTYYDLFNSRKAICSPTYRDDAMGVCWEGYAQERAPHIEQDGFKGGEKYAIAFIRHGMSSCSESSASVDSLLKSDVTMTVQVLPADEIGTYCNTVLA